MMHQVPKKISAESPTVTQSVKHDQKEPIQPERKLTSKSIDMEKHNYVFKELG